MENNEGGTDKKYMRGLRYGIRSTAGPGYEGGVGGPKRAVV